VSDLPNSNNEAKPRGARRPLAAANATREPVFDVLIIGGGIVGSGVARDAAMRGLRTVLVEQHDFAFGTSSRSSRLLHGGMRYLAQGRLGLVHEASVEKKVVHQIAPHLAQPLSFIFPTYRDNPAWKLWQLKIGVKLYDLLCGGRNFRGSKWLDTKKTSTAVPQLKTEGMAGAVDYYDALTNDARLVIDTLRSAVANGCLAQNYCRFENATFQEGTWRCELLDAETNEKIELQAYAVVNASGPWAEKVPHSSVKLRLTKGIHCVIQKLRLPVQQAVVMTEGKRILFAIPWGERVILGTTDTDYSGPLEDVRAAPEDVEYVLAVTNQFFPGARLTAHDVISVWAGLRPLIADPGGRPSDISRSHQINSPEPGWWDVSGGKLTTYRLMAEQTVDKIISWRKKNHSNNPLKPCQTAVTPILPDHSAQKFSGLLPAAVTREAVANYCQVEWARHLDDVMVRRTGWHYYLPEANEVARQVAQWMAEILGWTEPVRDVEYARYLKNTEPAWRSRLSQPDESGISVSHLLPSKK
jgi:glycerol-3-phosphate dehydrogenase